MRIKCTNCTHINDDRNGRPAKFCARCGWPLSGGIAPPPARHRSGSEPIPQPHAPVVAGQVDGMAVTAMVCGIVGLFMPIVGIVGLIVGIKANDRVVNSEGRLIGRPMAIVGIVCGSLALLGHLGFCCAVFSRIA